MTIRNLIFDLDGTLIDSSEGVVDATNYALRQVGEPEVLAEIITPYIGYPLEIMFADLTDAPITELWYHFQIRAADSVVGSAKLLDDVQPSLVSLYERGYSMAIATTKIRYHVEAIIEKFGWQEMFRVAVAGNDVARVKPEPDAFLLALERLEAQPHESLAIGDTINDVLAAQAIPMRVAAVRSPYGGDDKVLQLRPDYLLSGLPELVEVLCRQNGSSEALPARQFKTRNRTIHR